MVLPPGCQGKEYNFPHDESLLTSQPISGDRMMRLLPEGHPYRCKAATNRSLREARNAGLPLVYPNVKQCRQWKLSNGSGTPYCRFHGGNRIPKYNIRRSMSRYTANAGEQLRTMMERLSKEGPDQRHSLNDEVDAARMLAEQAMRNYEMACLGPQKGSPQLQYAVRQMLQESLDHVSKIVSKAARVRAISTTVVDAEVITYVVMQVTEIIEKEIRHRNPQLCDSIVEQMKNIKLPERSYTQLGGLQDRMVAALAEINGSVPGPVPNGL